MDIQELAAANTLMGIIIRFCVNLIVLFVLIRLIYYRFTRKEEYLFSFFIVGTIIFLIVSLLVTVDIKIGMALGLFAVFGILRFRTVNYSTKDMAYFFAVIGISIINSQALLPPPILSAIVINSFIVLTALILELSVRNKTLSSFTMTYNKTGMLAPALRKELLKELSDQTGLNIEKVYIRKLDVNKGTAEIEVYFLNNGYE